jgi:hypothetical protein
LALVYTDPNHKNNKGIKAEKSVTKCVSIMNTGSYLASKEVISGYVPTDCNTNGFGNLERKTTETGMRPGPLIHTSSESNVQGIKPAAGASGSGGQAQAKARRAKARRARQAGSRRARRARLARQKLAFEKAATDAAAKKKVADAEAAIAEEINLLPLHNYERTGRFVSACKTCNYPEKKCIANRMSLINDTVTTASAGVLTPEANAAVANAINTISHHKYNKSMFTKTCKECQKPNKKECTEAQENAVWKAVTQRS